MAAGAGHRYIPVVTTLIAFASLAFLHVAATLPVYFGNFENGIYSAEFNPADGSLSQPKLAATIAYPGYLVKHPKLPVIYANASDESGALVASFQLLPGGGLKLLNKADANPGGDTYVSVSHDGGTLFTANYSKGTVASYRLLPDGRVGERVSVLKQSGRGMIPQQDGPHAHCIDQDPSGNFVLVCDLGADKIYSYKFDERNSSLTPNKPPFFTQREGFGPRHLVFEKNAKHVYVVNELSAQITSFEYDPRTGELSNPRHTNMLPDDYKGRKWAGEIALDAAGKTLYASNRADDESISVFRFGKGGRLERIQIYHGNIHHPRHFTLDPTGHFLLIANMDARSVEVTKIDPDTGMLSATGKSARVPGPSCILFPSQ